MMKTKNDLDLLKKNLEELKPFRVIADNYDFGIFEYSKEDECYHQKETGWYKLDTNAMLRAIMDENYFIKVEM